MSIDARISAATFISDGTCRLSLEDRDSHSIAGQIKLYVKNKDESVRNHAFSLVGCEIWGGAENLMLGEKLIANRMSYTVIQLVDGWVKIVDDYRKEKEL